LMKAEGTGRGPVGSLPLSFGRDRLRAAFRFFFFFFIFPPFFFFPLPLFSPGDLVTRSTRGFFLPSPFFSLPPSPPSLSREREAPANGIPLPFPFFPPPPFSPRVVDLGSGGLRCLPPSPPFFPFFFFFLFRAGVQLEERLFFFLSPFPMFFWKRPTLFFRTESTPFLLFPPLKKKSRWFLFPLFFFLLLKLAGTDQRLAAFLFSFFFPSPFFSFLRYNRKRRI